MATNSSSLVVKRPLVLIKPHREVVSPNLKHNPHVDYDKFATIDPIAIYMRYRSILQLIIYSCRVKLQDPKLSEDESAELFCRIITARQLLR